MLLFAIKWHHFWYCTLWPWPSFSRCTVWNVNILEVSSTGAEMRKMTFIDCDICHRMAPLRMLYSVILTFVFKVKMRMITKLSHQICHNLYGTHHRIALVVNTTNERVLFKTGSASFPGPLVDDRNAGSQPVLATFHASHTLFGQQVSFHDCS